VRSKTLAGSSRLLHRGILFGVTWRWVEAGIATSSLTLRLQCQTIRDSCILCSSTEYLWEWLNVTSLPKRGTSWPTPRSLLTVQANFLDWSRKLCLRTWCHVAHCPVHTNGLIMNTKYACRRFTRHMPFYGFDYFFVNLFPYPFFHSLNSNDNEDVLERSG
jgi:hypothetical protein